jgi:hypothetical protein
MKNRYVFAIPVGFTFVALLLVYFSLGTRASLQPVPTQLEVELTTLRPAGFEPSEITRPKGPFVLFIDDRSGKETSLVLQRMNGERLRAINLNRKKSEWHSMIDLPPGTYVLQDAGNSELRCQITILP